MECYIGGGKNDGKEIKYLFVVSRSLRRFSLSQLHNYNSGSYLDISETMFKIKDRFFWFVMENYVDDRCTNCVSLVRMAYKSLVHDFINASPSITFGSV